MDSSPEKAGGGGSSPSLATTPFLSPRSGAVQADPVLPHQTSPSPSLTDQFPGIQMLSENIGVRMVLRIHGKT